MNSTLSENAQISLQAGVFGYRCRGDRRLPPVILLHALTADAASWDEVALALSQRFWVLALDQRGHGRSPRSQDYAFATMACDAIEFAAALQLDRFDLIGHSMGGIVAMLAAQSAPARVRTLIVEDAAPPWPGAAVPEIPDEAPSDIPFDWSVVRQYCAQLRAPDPTWWADLSRISARTLIVGGGSTSPVPQQMLLHAAAQIRGARVQTIEDAGHQVHATKCAEFLAAIEAFLP